MVCVASGRARSRHDEIDMPQLVYSCENSNCCMKTQLRTHLPDEAARAALAHLWKAFAYAQDLELDPWEFSLRLLHLVELGVDESDLRWLVVKRYVEHGEEITTFQDEDRRFRRGRNVAFTSETCFVLTEAGVGLVQDRHDEEDLAPPASLCSTVPFPLPASSPGSAGIPHWDSELRVLRFGSSVVKRFRQPSPNQEALLTTFEESGWPERIDDPLHPRGEPSPKQRLRFTIWRLNRNQDRNLIKFSGDGTGEGICWARVAETVFEQDDAIPLRRAA
jgi:hypothetical protein